MVGSENSWGHTPLKLDVDRLVLHVDSIDHQLPALDLLQLLSDCNDRPIGWQIGTRDGLTIREKSSLRKIHDVDVDAAVHEEDVPLRAEQHAQTGRGDARRRQGAPAPGSSGGRAWQQHRA